jgi:hypothetical protein
MFIIDWFTSLLKHPANSEAAPSVTQVSDAVAVAATVVPIAESKNDVVSFESLWNDFDKRVPHWMPINLPPQTVNKERLERWLASTSTSGYVREEALRNLIYNYQTGDENRILLRLSDWVEPVRVLAESWVIQNFSQLNLDAIQKNQKLLFYLSRKQHLKINPAYLAIVENLLRRAANLDSQAFNVFTAPFRRYLYLESLNRKGELREHIIQDSEVSSRTLLLTTKNIDLTQAERSAFSKDRSGLVAKSYLRWRIAKNENVSQFDIQKLALHSAKSTREFARFYLEKLFQFDVYAFYKTQTGNEFFFICDFAKTEDLKCFFAGLDHSKTAVRQMCLEALLACDHDAVSKLNIPHLVSQSGKCRKLLSSHLHVLSDDSLLKIMPHFSSQNGYGQLGFLTVFERRSKWLCISQIADIAATLDSSKFRIASRLLSKILEIGRSLNEPLTESRKTRVQAALNKLSNASDTAVVGIRKQIEYLLQTSSR